MDDPGNRSELLPMPRQPGLPPPRSGQIKHPLRFKRDILRPLIAKDDDQIAKVKIAKAAGKKKPAKV